MRHDGTRFTVIDQRIAPALASGTAGGSSPLLVDEAGVLWIDRSDGALAKYERGRFTVAAPPIEPGTRISHALATRDGTLLTVTGSRLFRLAGDRLVAFAEAPSLPDTGITRVAPDTADGLWIGTRTQGLWHVRGGEATPVAIPYPARAASTSPLIQTRSGDLWLNGEGLLRRHRGVWQRQHIGDARTGVSRIVEDPRGGVWVGVFTLGLARFDDDGWEVFRADDGLSGAVTSGLLLDDEGSVWITTGGGLDRFRPSTFVVLDRRAGMPNIVPLHILGDRDGSLWVQDYRTLRSWRVSGGPVGRSGGLVSAMQAPGDEVPFASSVQGGVWRFRLHADWFERTELDRRVPLPSSPLLRWSGLRRGVEADDGTLWIGGRQLVRVRDGVAREVPLPPGGGRVVALAPDGARGAWVAVGPESSVLRFDGDSVVATVDQADGLPPRLAGLTPIGRDTLWAYTDDGLLVRVAPGRPRTVAVEGLKNPLAAGSAVLLASREHLWLGSGGGIGRVRRDRLDAFADGQDAEPEVEWFGEPDGLPIARTTPSNSRPGFAGPDGRLWFATPAGVAVVDPEAIPTNAVPPAPRIEAVVADGRVIEEAGQTTIGPNPEQVEFRLTAGSLRMPERVRLEYRLDGVDRDWIASGLERVAHYTQLRPRRYRLRVRAWNESGLASAGESTLAFRVLPAWYQTVWFGGLVTLSLMTLGAGLVVVAVRSRHREATARVKQRYEAALTERTRMARELHDTLLQGFGGITMRLHAIRHRARELEPETSNSLGQLLEIADRTLGEARQMIWDMRAPELEHHDLVEALGELTARPDDEGPELRFEVDGRAERLPIEVETTVLRVAREAIANLRQHARAVRAVVRLSFEPAAVALSVEDDGVGIDPTAARAAATRGHWGLAGMRERAERVGGSLEIDRAPGGGTSVQLRVPLAARPG
ncbi:MAG: histidine kinase [Gemmatimonadales bacterium]